jgi:hypothetical protein
VRAARWDTDAELGGSWTVTVKRLAGGVALTLATPCTLDLWAVGKDPVADAPVKSVSGVLGGGNTSAAFTLSAAEVSTLGVGHHEDRLILGDPTIGPQVMSRGWMIVRGTVDDL